MELKNCMEEIVLDIIDDIIKNIDVCSCEKCLLDIAALALNALPPKYVVTEAGGVYSKKNTLRIQFNVDIMTAIVEAAKIVKGNPRHDNIKQKDMGKNK